MVTLLRAGALMALAVMLCAARFHPIHAARVELDVANTGAVVAIVHVYKDDFPAGQRLQDVGAYFDRVLVITDAHNGRVALRATDVATEGDRLRISLLGSAALLVSHGRIALTLLQERYADQVNVVDARIGGRRAQLVFLRGDGPQSLP